MPVEIRTADHRHWARTVHQHHARAPHVRLFAAAERRRARWRATLAAAALLAAGLIVASFSPSAPAPLAAAERLLKGF